MDGGTSLYRICAALAAAKEALQRDKILSGLPPDERRSSVTNEDVDSLPNCIVNRKLDTSENENANEENSCDYSALTNLNKKQVNFTNQIDTKDLEHGYFENDSQKNIERLLRKYNCPNIAMLKTGEYSPNNPELAGDGRISRGGDAFLGFGVYEEKRKKLLLKRRNEYREYLAKQNQINLLRKGQLSPEKLRKSQNNEDKLIRSNLVDDSTDWIKNINKYDRSRRPSSIGVQTDPDDQILMSLNRRSSNTLVTEAERELSPRPSINENNTDWRMMVEKVNIGTQNNLIVPPIINRNQKYTDNVDIVSAYMENKHLLENPNYTKDYIADFNDINKNIYRKDSPRARLLQDLSHTYMPSLFDAEAIRQRNARIEEDAAAKRLAYQQELKKQIEDQQRLKEERKIREKLLEEAETKKLEEQLKALKLVHESEVERQKELSIKLRNEAIDYEQKRLKLQNEIDTEKKCINEIKTKTYTVKDSKVRSNVATDKDEIDINTKKESYRQYPSPKPTHEPVHANLLGYNVRRNNPYVGQDIFREKSRFSSNVPDSSFSQSIPVKNYNSSDAEPVPYSMNRLSKESRSLRIPRNNDNVRIITNNAHKRNKPSYEPAFLSKKITDMIDIKAVEKQTDRSDFEDSLPIPILREPERNAREESRRFVGTIHEKNSDAMKNLEQKWQIPAVQRNILKNNYNEDGKQENILTQLGSIRKQLQLEQLKMDQSHYFNNQKLVK